MTLGQKSFLCIVFWKNLDTNKSFCSDLIFIYIPAFFCSSLSGPLLNFDSDQNSSLLSEVGIQPTVMEPSGMSLNYKTFWCQSNAIICIIFLLLSSIPRSLICATFWLIKNRDVKLDFAKNKKQLESSETKTVPILGATYAQQAWKNLVGFGKCVEHCELLLRTNLIAFISKSNVSSTLYVR